MTSVAELILEIANDAAIVAESFEAIEDGCHIVGRELGGLVSLVGFELVNLQRIV